MSEMQPQNQPQVMMSRTEGGSEIINADERAAAKAAQKQKCHETLERTYERVMQIKHRIISNGLSPIQEVITVINLDDPQGAFLASVLTPDLDMQAGREPGEEPFTQNLASKERVQGFLDMIDEDAAAKLFGMSELSIVVVDHGVAEVFPA